jgi:hypothetical protein
LYISNFKKYFYILFVIIVTSVAIECLVDYTLKYFYSDSSSLVKANTIESIKGKHDIIVIGDSRIYQGIDTRQLSQQLTDKKNATISAYNLGTPGMQAPFYYLLFKKYLDSHEPPKVLIMNISYYLLGGLEWFEGLYLNFYNLDLNEVNVLLETPFIEKTKVFSWYLKSKLPSMRASQVFPNILKYNLDWNRAIKTFNMSKSVYQSATNQSLKGYFSRKDEAFDDCVKFGELRELDRFGQLAQMVGFSESDICVPISAATSTSSHIGYSMFDTYFQKVFELAQSKNIKVLILQFPWPEWYSRNNDFRKAYEFYQKHILSWTKNYPNVQMLDNKLYYEESAFADPLHVNQKGADRLTSEISDIILNKKLIY